MTDSSSSPNPTTGVELGALHYDHERAGYFIPEFNEDEDTFEVTWPFREEWHLETRNPDQFETHYAEFCEVVPEAIMENPMEVVFQFAFNEYESMRSRLGGGHSYEMEDVDRVSDLGVALRLFQKETEQTLE